MKAIAGLVFGTLLGGIIFFVLHFQQLLLIGRGQAGLLLTMQLNSTVDTYLFGGAILGMLFVLIIKESK